MKLVKPIRTVNVIEFSEDSAFQIIGMASYPDTKAGNKAAEARMIAVVKENDESFDETNIEDVDAMLDNGYHEAHGWCVIITHSTE